MGKLLIKLISRWCLLHRSGFQHQIASAPTTYYIAFFSLIQFKYGTLTHQFRSLGSVVISALSCHTEGSGIDLRWTRLANIVLESNIAIEFFFFL